MCLLLHWAPCYIISHTLIFVIYGHSFIWRRSLLIITQIDREVSEDDQIGRSGVTEKKRSPETTKKKWLPCQRHPLFIYFDKRSFALIIHDNACPARSVCPLSWQPQLGAGFSVRLMPKTPSPASLEMVSCFHL